MPVKWSTTRLGDLCTKIGSGATPRGGRDVYLPRSKYALIRSQNVHNDGFRSDGVVFINDRHAAELDGVEVRSGDVLLNITGDSVARSCRVDDRVLPARVNQHVAIVRADPTRLDPLFLRYFLIAPETQSKLLSWAGSGATRNALTKGMLEAFEIIAPSDVMEQRAIGATLAKLDDKIELNRRMSETLEEIARALFRSWFVDFDPVHANMEGRDTGLPRSLAELFPDRLELSDLGNIPSGWRVTSLGQLFRPKDECVLTGPFGSNLHAHDYRDEGVPLILVKHVVAGRVLDHDVPLVGKHKLPELARYRLQLGDIVFTRVGAVGRSAYVHPPTVGWLISGQLLRIRIPNWEVVHPRYLAQLFLEKAFTQVVEAHALGTTRPSLNTRLLLDLKFVLPTPGLLRIFAEMASSLDAKVQAAARESKALAELRDALLPKLLSGEMRVGAAREQLGCSQ